MMIMFSISLLPIILVCLGSLPVSYANFAQEEWNFITAMEHKKFERERRLQTKGDPHGANGESGQSDHVAIPWKTLNIKAKMANKNLRNHNQKFADNSHNSNKHWGTFHLGASSLRASGDFVPGQPAQNFTLDTIAGILSYPSEKFKNASFIFHTFDNDSAFLECLWTSPSSLKAIASSPASVNYVFMSPSNKAKEDAYWMRSQLGGAVDGMMRRGEISKAALSLLKDRLHFVTTPMYQVGNWIPELFMAWSCEGHGCGLYQAAFRSTTGKTATVVLKRLDARYDWLPSPAVVFSSPQTVILAGDGCQKSADVTNKITLVVDGNCSYSTKVSNMQDSSAAGVIVYSRPGEPVQDMNCEGAECYSPPSIPATMIPYSEELIQSLGVDMMSVSFQTTPSENFYFAIDRQGLLAEMGWLLYPSFQFFIWQAQWFDYRTELLTNLSREAEVIPVINATIMQGHTGVVTTIQVPSLSDVSRIELDTSLSCPGTRDEECPPWDHTVQLYLCCDQASPLCGMELGRWITPFRRRIGRWLTDVTPLAPLFNADKCTFTMKSDAWWAQPWKPSLNLRLHRSGSVNSRPLHILPLFRGGTFNQSYNSHYKPINFTPPADTYAVVLYAVITGHGSDNNGCGEFCVTSHHFVVNGNSNIITFSNAGTPTGCADRTPTGVEPNEHGTWLYGRDGWCDGREVDPWVQDITYQLDLRSSNSITYFGWFNGMDPNPTRDPGEIIMYSYLVMYG